MNVFVRRSEAGDGNHGPVLCDALKQDMKDHAKAVMKIYDDIDACDESDPPCNSDELNKLFTKLVAALTDQADAIAEYNRRCLISEIDKWVG